MRTPIIESLAKHHIKHTFDCDKASLTHYIRAIASQHQKRGLGRTYVAIYEDDPTVMGYYTLAASKVSFEHWPENSKLPPNMGIPTILLGKLAVGNAFKGRKLGEFLLYHAMWRSVQIAQSIGAMALEVDVLDDEALGFYHRYDFQVLQDNPLHLFQSIETIRRLNLDFSSVTKP